MGIFFVYILKSSICLAAFYLFYRLLLSRETFHRFNRFTLLSLLLLSCLLPLVEISVKQQSEVHQTMMTLEQWLLLADMMSDANHVTQAQESTLTWIQIALLVYLAGIFFFVLRNLYSLFRLMLLLKSGKKEDISKYVTIGSRITLIVHSKEIAPFSWMKYIVIAQKDLEENGREILIHELAHIRNRHSWDLLVADICIFIQWFNPASWLLKQELQNIHEYEADETVINEGVDAKQYQLLLIKKAVGTRLYSMANSFNHSKLKKRITMMLKEKSSPWARLKYLYVLPVAAIAVTAFARPEVSNATEEISRMSDALGREQVNSLFSRFHDISAVKVNDFAAIVEKKVAENAETTLGSISVNALPKDTAKVVKKVKRNPETAEQAGKQKTTMTVVSSGNDAANIKLEYFAEKPLCIVDGKEMDFSAMQALNPEKIERISVLKGQEALREYGEKGKNGVMLVTLKSGDKLKVVGEKSTNIKKSVSYSVKTEGIKAMVTVYIDGVKVDLGDKQLEDVVPVDQIESVNVNKSSDGKGEIYIVTKKDDAKVIITTTK